MDAVICEECGYRMHPAEDDCINCLHLAGEWPPENGLPFPLGWKRVGG